MYKHFEPLLPEGAKMCNVWGMDVEIKKRSIFDELPLGMLCSMVENNLSLLFLNRHFHLRVPNFPSVGLV